MNRKALCVIALCGLVSVPGISSGQVKQDTLYRSDYGDVPRFGGPGSVGGQLEEEISNNAWLTITADTSILFDTPVDKRMEVVSQMLFRC